MSFDVWTLYVATLILFMVTPGPSHLLMLTNSMNHGFKKSLATGAGDLTANTLQMTAAGLGLAALLVATQGALTWIKWAGVTYLIWMGVRMWRRDLGGEDASTKNTERSVLSLWSEGFLTSAANPKAIAFFAALFPQFIVSDSPFWPQFIILSLTYLVVDGSFLTTYGAAARGIAARLKEQRHLTINKLGGLFLIVAAIIMAFKSVE